MHVASKNNLTSANHKTCFMPVLPHKPFKENSTYFELQDPLETVETVLLLLLLSSFTWNRFHFLIKGEVVETIAALVRIVPGSLRFLSKPSEQNEPICKLLFRTYLRNVYFITRTNYYFKHFRAYNWP